MQILGLKPFIMGHHLQTLKRSDMAEKLRLLVASQDEVQSHAG